MRGPLLKQGLVAYVALSVALGACIGVGRSFGRMALGLLTRSFVLKSVLGNAGLALCLALALLPLLLLFLVIRKPRSEGQISKILAVAVVTAYCLFGVVVTDLSYRGVLSGNMSQAVQEMGYWLPGLLVVVLLAWKLVAGQPLSRAAFRALAIGGIILAGGLMTGWHFSTADDHLELVERQTAKRRPNVFIILVDTLRADHLPFYGYEKPTSPVMAAFASQAQVYTRAFAHAPATKASCAALMTSRYPNELGVEELGHGVPTGVPLLPQFLKAEGYTTGGIVANAQVTAPFGFKKGYDHFDIGSTYFRWAGLHKPLVRLGLIEPREELTPRYNAAQLTRRAISWVSDELPSGKPLFLYLHYIEPHAPYQPPPGEDRWREFAGPAARDLPKAPVAPPRRGRDALVPAVQLEAMVAHYDADIAFFDHEIVAFLDFLRHEDLFDDSLIFFIGDHGEEFFEHGAWEHGHSLYNELLHVPLVVKYPAQMHATPGLRIDRLAGLVDVIPTIRDVLGASWPARLFRGSNLMAEPAPEEKAVYAFAARAKWPSQRAVILGSDKLIQVLDKSGGVVKEMAFDLTTDFGETDAARHLSVLPEARLAKMRELLLTVAASNSKSSTEVVLDDETREELRALGYVQ